MAFRDREEYEAWKARQDRADASRRPAESSARTRPERTAGPEPGDIELRMSPLYGLLTLFAGVVFSLLGVMPWNKGGPAFRTLCFAVGGAAVVGGILLLRNRRVIVRMTSGSLQIPEAVIPWTAIEKLERESSRRNFWIHIHLKTKRTDPDAAALKARAALRALGLSSDFDYTVLETDLPRSGPWFIEECQRRIAAAGTAKSENQS